MKGKLHLCVQAA